MNQRIHKAIHYFFEMLALGIMVVLTFLMIYAIGWALYVVLYSLVFNFADSVNDIFRITLGLLLIGVAFYVVLVVIPFLLKKLDLFVAWCMERFGFRINISKPAWLQHIENVRENRRQEKRLIQTTMQRVNNDPSRSRFIIKDIGLLVYEDITSTPKVIRSQPVPLEARYLRPFAEVEDQKLVRSDTPIRVELEICEEHAAVLFKETMNLDQSRQICIASQMLDTQTAQADLDDKHWSVRVRVDGQLIALHIFTWSKIGLRHIEAEAVRDGEISSKMRQLLKKEAGLTSISLDELLAERGEG